MKKMLTSSIDGYSLIEVVFSGAIMPRCGSSVLSASGAVLLGPMNISQSLKFQSYF